MKKLLLISAFAATATAASSQCTANQLYADSVYGVWPDTTVNFAPAYINTFYSDTLQLLIPSDAGALDPAYAGYTLVKVDLVSVDGLPPGVTVACNSHTADPCTFLTGQVGCGLIEGTPTEAGTFPLVINVLPYVDFFGTVIASPFGSVPFQGYEIEVNTTAGIAAANVAGISGARNVPNPFTNRTTIEFQNGRAGMAHVQVYSLVGDVVWDQHIQAKAGLNKVNFDGSELPAGVYLYKIGTGSNTFTGRMALQR
ncbi:MAG: T9SS type A sorting domain-containing protein [Flavobacteriales bacterium]|nr:T9SS type A sorting domain-containing protein [Flavobacteriales bacterium]